jgi:hypothetical protein
MKLKELFFGKMPSESASYIDDNLGALIWNKNDEVWVGEINGLKLEIAHERNMISPSHHALEYAQEVFNDPSFLEKILKEEKERFIAAIPAVKEISDQLDIVKGLYITDVYISTKNKTKYLYLALGPEYPDKLWRVFFHNGKSGMLGFDS